MTDTTPEAAELQRRILREMSVDKKGALLVEMCDAMWALALRGIRERHPEYDEREARFALWRMLHGDELFRRAWPKAPLLAP